LKRLPNSNSFATYWRRLVRSRRLHRGLLVAAGLFVLLNGLVYLLYHNRTYPNTSIAGKELGSISRSKLPERIKSLQLLPAQVSFVQGKQTVDIKTSELAVAVDNDQQLKQLMAERSWLPVANILHSHHVPLAVSSQDAKTDKTIEMSLTAFQHSASDAQLVKQGGSFAVQPDQASQQVDTKATQQRLLAALRDGQTQVSVAVVQQPAHITAASLQPKLSELQQKTRLAISLRYDGKTKKFSANEITGWYVEENSSVVLSASAVSAAVSDAGRGLGVRRIGNLKSVSDSVVNSLRANKAASLDLQAAPPGKRFTYCTALRGVPESELSTLNASLAKTYADSRGWGQDGLIEFDKVDSGCDFTVWLASADQMASFGAICDNIWSCTVPPNVIINYDRWRYTTDSWKANAGGTLDDYRAMAINHETGHELGFGHSGCPAAGQPAPVMEQQSIDLQGCTFSPWPDAIEQAALRSRLGL
jgi:hypothetical protein